MARFLATGCVVVLAGCKYPALPSVGDASNGESCILDSDCTEAGFLVCDPVMNRGTCVQCTATNHIACIGTTPRCENDSCVACVDDSDCTPNGVCLPSGACAAPSSIIHAISTGGSEMMTCGGIEIGDACTLDTALAITVAGRNVIRLDDRGPYVSSMSVNFIVNNDTAIDLILDARGAILHRKGDGPILTINNNKGITILGGTIEGAHGSGGDGIRCGMGAIVNAYDTTITMNDESAINASNCTVSVTHATIASNNQAAAGLFPGLDISSGSITISRSQITSNRGGGIAVNSGTFMIIGNAFLNNGTFDMADGSGSATGGIAISTTVNAANRLAFNTVARNLIQAGVKSGGIDCNAGTNIVGYYNIVWDNNPMAMGDQISGGCKHTYSDVGPAVLASTLDAGHTLDLNPQLVDEQSDPHLKAASPARGYAPSDADLGGLAAKDIDGDARTAPADLGADQVHGP